MIIRVYDERMLLSQINWLDNNGNTLSNLVTNTSYDEAGRLLYVFPDLQKTAGGRGSGGSSSSGRGGWGTALLTRGRELVVAPPPVPALEAPIPFTRATSGQRLAAAAKFFNRPWDPPRAIVPC